VLIAGVLLVATPVIAAEPMVLTEQQLDGITAGSVLQLDTPGVNRFITEHGGEVILIISVK
jgi:hypothetical protein